MNGRRRETTRNEIHAGKRQNVETKKIMEERRAERKEIQRTLPSPFSVPKYDSAGFLQTAADRTAVCTGY
jgi:hypothetical protein